MNQSKYELLCAHNVKGYPIVVDIVAIDSLYVFYPSDHLLPYELEAQSQIFADTIKRYKQWVDTVFIMSDGSNVVFSCLCFDHVGEGIYAIMFVDTIAKKWTISDLSSLISVEEEKLRKAEEERSTGERRL